MEKEPKLELEVNMIDDNFYNEDHEEDYEIDCHEINLTDDAIDFYAIHDISDGSMEHEQIIKDEMALTYMRICTRLGHHRN